MSQVVVDASFVIKWMVVESDSVSAINKYRSWTRHNVAIIMPRWATCEISNALLQRVINGEFTTAYAAELLRELPRFTSFMETQLEHSGRTLTLAHHFGLRSVYDLHYLVLAEELNCELWTADERFWRTVSGEFPFVRWLGNLTVSQ